jgi:hypothetical protein|tara:strand:+ start:477 stop:953 length:477 start_codon:yes stop_codon:yes gene_type:complete
MTPLISEVLSKVAKAKTKDQKVRILRENDTPPLRMILKASFDPSIEWALPDGDVPYERNDAPDGTEHTNLAHESRLLFHFIKGGNPALNQLRRENMFLQLLEGLSKDEADIVIAAKDGALHRKYKGLSDAVVKEAFGWTDNYMQPEPTKILEGHEPRF